ncbi:MAG TPA: hypothetical protein VE684_06970, partial [Crenalkalicoccus sp.]|nr:hypothetical protein [Crenalkalicoccus sp.]
RLEGADGPSRAELTQALTALGLPPRTLLLRREAGGLAALAEVEGIVAATDPRLGGLPAQRILPLGFYAVPVRGE